MVKFMCMKAMSRTNFQPPGSSSFESCQELQIWMCHQLTCIAQQTLRRISDKRKDLHRKELKFPGIGSVEVHSAAIIGILHLSVVCYDKLLTYQQEIQFSPENNV